MSREKWIFFLVAGLFGSEIIDTTLEDVEKHGKPCLKGTRVPVYLILDLLAGGSTAEEIIDDYPDITLEDIKACLEYASLVPRFIDAITYY